MDSSDDKSWLKRITKLEKISNNHVRSNGIHSCGFNVTSRIFGGHTIGQSYYVFKFLYPNKIVTKLNTNFISAGNINDSLDYYIDNNDINNTYNDYIKINVKQNNKLIAIINIRYINNNETFIKNLINFPINVKTPEYYSCLIREDTLQPFTNKMNNIDEPLFEIRPINPDKFLFYNDSFEEVYAWLKINPKFLNNDIKLEFSLLIPLIMSDYFIFHPSVSIYNYLEQMHLAVIGSSLNHQVIIHCNDNQINPYGYFLFKLKCNTISQQCSIIDGQLFDENKQLIITYRQQNFYSTN